jgi:hypothetical protein
MATDSPGEVAPSLSPGLDAASGRPPVNTHVHLPPNFSAFTAPEQAVRMAAAEGLAAVGTANYHHFGVYRRFAEAAAQVGIVPLFGLEIITLIDGLPGDGMLINDPTNLNRMYLCGKGLTQFDPPSASASRRMAAMRAASDERMRQMTRLMASRFAQAGLDGSLTDERIAISVADRCDVPVEWVSLQERHLAQAFAELLLRDVGPEERGAALRRLFEEPASVDPADPVAVQEALRSNLMKAGKPAFVPDAAVSFDDAYRLILELGGIPCYPILADGASPICAFEDPPVALAERLLSRGIYCAELIPGRNTGAVVDDYVTALRRAGIVIMAGTEHNTLRMIPLNPMARGGQPLSDAAGAAFWEGACVVAGHQHLSAIGQPGYVDEAGHLASGYYDTEARIGHFRQVGADMIGNGTARG